MKALYVSALCSAFVMASAAAQAPDGKAIFKGRVKPGLYQQVDQNETRGMAGVPKGQEKTTETKQRCITPAEIDQGLEFRNDCKFTKNEQTNSSMYLVAQCPDGSVTEFRLAATANGFTTDFVSKGKNADGSPLVMSLRSEAKYLGACKG